jgi:CRP/FNR family cyclic AMP-dependent transcriptional regulator
MTAWFDMIAGGSPDRSRLRTLLESAPLLRSVPADMIDQLASQFRAIEVPAGEAIVRQGDAGEELYLVEAGALEATVEVEGKRVRLGLLGPGDVFGEMSLLRSAPRMATVTAVEPSFIWSLSRASLERAVEQAPALAANLRSIMRRRDVANALRALQ